MALKMLRYALTGKIENHKVDVLYAGFGLKLGIDGGLCSNYKI